MECEPAPWLIPWRSARLAGLVTDPALDALPLDAHRRAAHLRFSSVETILHALFDEELHSAQVDSLANAAGGVLVAGSLALRAIGRGYALLSE